MTSLDEFIAAVDKFMPLPKVLVGASGLHQWQQGRDGADEACLKLPIEVGGVQSGQLLHITAFPEHPTLKFRVGIYFGQVLCRLDFDLEAKHGNNLIPRDVVLPSLVTGPHWHSWELNRHLFKSVTSYTRLKCAAPLDAGVRKFDAALRWYCAQRKIQLGQHGIVLPGPRRLI